MRMRMRMWLKLGSLLLTAALIGCGSKADDKQPKVSGDPDPRLKGAGPALPGTEGKDKKGNPTPGIE